MSTCNRCGQFSTIILLIILSFISVNSTAETEPYDVKTSLGESLSRQEIEKYMITIFPDGTNLPEGQGSVEEGGALYQSMCQACHGEKGIEGPAARLVGNNGWFSFSDPARILRIKDYPILLISVGGLWPYATTIFDYVRRAMPHFAPKSLTNNQVYGLTAYILYLNELIGPEVILDKDIILEVKMPGEDLSVFPNTMDKEEYEFIERFRNQGASRELNK